LLAPIDEPKSEDDSRGHFAAFRLPRGRHTIPREQVAENQRWRLLGACAEILSTRGYARTTITELVSIAGVSRATFYQHYDDLEGCICATFEMAAGGLLATLANACDVEPAPADPLGSGVAAALSFLAEEPALAAILVTEGLPGIAEARAELLTALAACLAAARGEEVEPSGERRLFHRHLIGGAIVWLSIPVGSGEAQDLPSLAGELTQLLSGKYPGAAPEQR
jgi:AcrR family transcriptional regulator